MTLPSDLGYGFRSDGKLCIDVGTCKCIPFEFIKFNLDYVLMNMLMWAFMLVP